MPGFDSNAEFQRMADESDRASMLEMSYNDDAVEAVRKMATTPETHPDFDGKHCVECDEKIPALRLQMGKVRCVDCQAKLEATQRNYRH